MRPPTLPFNPTFTFTFTFNQAQWHLTSGTAGLYFTQTHGTKQEERPPLWENINEPPASGLTSERLLRTQ